MTNINVVGLGKITVHACTSTTLKQTIDAFSSLAILTPQAIFFVSNSNHVSESGVLLTPHGRCIPLFSGGVLTTPKEIIETSLVLVGTEYKPSDFSFA